MVKKKFRVGEMAHWLKADADKHEDVSSIPGTHMEEGKKSFPQVVL